MPSKMLAIEVDPCLRGSEPKYSHRDQVPTDRARNIALEKLGWTVIRFRIGINKRSAAIGERDVVIGAKFVTPGHLDLLRDAVDDFLAGRPAKVRFWELVGGAADEPGPGSVL